TAIHLDYGRPELLAAVPEEEASEYHRAALARLKQDRNDFLAHNQGQRLGPAILVAPFLALFGLPGLRLAFVLQGLLLPGLGFVLGCRLLRRPWAAWAAAVLLAVNPWSLGVQVFDENFMASCFGSLMLALLLRERPAWAAAGMSLGLFLGIRHVGVLMVPFLLGFAWWTVRRPRPLLELCGAAALAGLPCAVLHTFLWIQTGTPFEGAIGRPPAQHSFLGLDFDLSVLLNFPFVDEPLRSPYMAWPPLIAFPLDLLRRLGILAAALLPAGIVHIWRREPGSAFLLASWAVPLWLLVMVQSNWIEPNKMGVPAAALAPVVIALVGGAAFLLEGARRAWRRWALWAGTAVAAAGCGALLAGVETTVDERVLSSRPAYLAEIFPKGTALDLAEKPEFPDLDRERHRLRLLPDLPVDTWHPVHVGRRLGQLVRELASPALDAYAGPPVSVLHLAMTGRRQYVGPLSLARSMRRGPGASPWEAFGPCPGAVGEPNGETVTAVVDLSVPPSLSCAPVEVTSGEPGCLELTPGTARVVRDLAVPWAEEPVVAVVGRSCDGSAYVATGPRGV
ncbi:MAG: hypothetical protein FJ098_16230, partial [Deltaproteobacteria bacterium]|nr:hypothetical protein [Deltaproteobacteria bacterium]